MGLCQNREHRSSQGSVPTLSKRMCWLGGSFHQRLQGCQSLAEHLSLFRQRHRFSSGTTGAKIVTQFVKRTTKTSCRRESSKPAHGIVSLFDASVILLQIIIEVFIRPMLDSVAHDFVYSPWIGTMPVCRDRFWRMANPGNRLLEEPLSRLHISLFA